MIHTLLHYAATKTPKACVPLHVAHVEIGLNGVLWSIGYKLWTCSNNGCFYQKSVGKDHQS